MIYPHKKKKSEKTKQNKTKQNKTKNKIHVFRKEDTPRISFFFVFVFILTPTKTLSPSFYFLHFHFCHSRHCLLLSEFNNYTTRTTNVKN